MNAKKFCVLALIALTIALALTAPATTTALEKADTSTINSATVQSIDDTLYLRRGPPGNNLTTAAPTNTTAATITVSIGSRVIIRWINGTIVPSGYNWTIAGGNYTFYCYMTKTMGSPTAHITFKFGYIRQSEEVVLVTGGPRSFNGFHPINPKECSVIVTNVGAKSIPSGSRLFIEVNITVTGTGAGGVNFHYDGINQKTRIETPPIGLVAVPEFPLGVFSLLPIMLLAYFILKRRLVRFRA